MFKRGNTAAGSIRPEDVVELLRLYNEEGWTQRALGERFNLSTIQIGRIVRGESWRHLSGTSVNRREVQNSEAIFAFQSTDPALYPAGSLPAGLAVPMPADLDEKLKDIVRGESLNEVEAVDLFLKQRRAQSVEKSDEHQTGDAAPTATLSEGVMRGTRCKELHPDGQGIPRPRSQSGQGEGADVEREGLSSVDADVSTEAQADRSDREGS